MALLAEKLFKDRRQIQIRKKEQYSICPSNILNYFFRVYKKTCADNLKRVEDPTASLNQHIEVAEKLFEEVFKVVCYQNNSSFFFLKRQRKIELGQKRKLELKSKLASKNKKKKELSTTKCFFKLVDILLQSSSETTNINSLVLIKYNIITKMPHEKHDKRFS